MIVKIVGVLVFVLLALPTPVLIGIGVVITILVAIGYAASMAGRAEERRREEQRRRKEQRERMVRERAASVKRHREDAERKEKEQAKRHVEALGKQGAALLARANASVRQIVSTEAARQGWLGDIGFAPDVRQIEADLLSARAFRAKGDELSALPRPNDDDRVTIAEVKAKIAQLERTAKERVALLDRCAAEARLIDESLRRERDDARVAATRERLHGELAAMLYGVDAATATAAEPVVDAVMARVQAYREIKGDIDRARDEPETPAKADDGSWFSQAWKWIVD